MKESSPDVSAAVAHAVEHDRTSSINIHDTPSPSPDGGLGTRYSLVARDNVSNSDSNNAGAVVCRDVREDDVLCGRGSISNRHPGNIRYRSLVKKQQMRYLRAHRLRKGEIASDIVQSIRNRGGRFLKASSALETTWFDIGDEKAREKTSQALREGLSQRLYSRMHKMGRVSGKVNLESTRGPSGEKRSVSDFKLPCKKRKVIDTRSDSKLDTALHPIKCTDILPTGNDVLLGKGKAIQDHEGNVRFRSLVNNFRERYQAAPKKAEKARISYEVVRMIRGRGGRFLRYSSTVGKYSDVGDEQAKEKVSHALRNRKPYSSVSP